VNFFSRFAAFFHFRYTHGALNTRQSFYQPTALSRCRTHADAHPKAARRHPFGRFPSKNVPSGATFTIAPEASRTAKAPSRSRPAHAPLPDRSRWPPQEEKLPLAAAVAAMPHGQAATPSAAAARRAGAAPAARRRYCLCRGAGSPSGGRPARATRRRCARRAPAPRRRGSAPTRRGRGRLVRWRMGGGVGRCLCRG
jgi:hypothetical protein